MLQDVGSERAVLAGIYQYGQEAGVDVADIISADSFTVEANQVLYTCINTALEDNDRLDLTAIMTTAERLGLNDRITKDKKDIAYIRSLLNFPIKLENVRNYAKRLAKLDFARKAQEAHKDAHSKLGEITGAETIDAILGISESAVFDLIQEINQGREDQPALITEDSDELLEHLINNPCEMAGLPTPWKHYNTAIGGGLRRGGVNLIGARPKAGKTTIGKEIALHFTLELGLPVLFLDTEMIRNDQLFRSLASLSNVRVNDIETGTFGANEEERIKVFEANKKLKEARFYHKSIAGKPFEEVLSIIRRWIVKEVGYDENGEVKDCLVIYDYFKLMSPDVLNDMQEYQALGFQVSRLSDFTKEYNFPCLAFVQLNRDGITKETSDIISQSDRLVWLCHSVTIFKKKDDDEIHGDGKEFGDRKLIVLETRFGKGMEMNDYINIKFEGEIAKMTEVNRKSDIDKDRQFIEDGFGTEDVVDGNL